MHKSEELKDALHFVAEKAWEGFSKDFFDALTRYIGEQYAVDYVIVDKLISPERAETLSLFANGDISPNLQYSLQGTPCENVAGRTFCFYPCDIQSLFPEDHLLVEMGATSYMGIPLWDSKGKPNGLIVLINSKEFKNPEIIKSVLQIFAARAGAEIERQQFEEKLKEREQHLSLLLDSTEEAIYGLDIQGSCTFANRSCLNLLGYSSEDDLIGQKMHDLIHHTTQDGCHYPLDQCKIYKSFLTGEKIYEDNEVLWRKDGKFFPVEYWSHPILNAGEVVGSVVTFLDISERKKMLEEHKRTAQLAALGTVAAGVAHEINNPIQGILNYATLIKNSPENTNRVNELSPLIIKECDRIANITKDLLFYSKDTRSSKIESDIRPLIESSVRLLSSKMERQGVYVRTHFSADLPKVYLQPQEIQQVIINLIDNAYDALRVDGNSTGEKLIDISAEIVDLPDRPQLRIRVSDHGIGIPDEIKTNVTEAFFSTKPSSEGSGLGLSIVNNIIARHGGVLNIESKPGGYTHVDVLIPLSELAF